MSDQQVTVVVADDSPTLRRIVVGRARQTRASTWCSPRTASRPSRPCSAPCPTSSCSTSRCRACPGTSLRACSRTTGRPRTSRCCSSPRSTPRATATGAPAPAPSASSPRTSRHPSSSTPCARRWPQPSGPAAGRAALKADPLELSDDDVMARVCDLLDRKLFEASVTQDVTTIAADVHGFEETVAAVLESMENIVDCDLVSVMLLAGDGMAPEATYVSVAREVTQQHYREFLEAVAEAADQATGGSTSIGELQPLVADPHGRLGAADTDGVENPGMATFLSMPLRAGGRAARGCSRCPAAPRTPSGSPRSPPCGSSHLPRPSSSTTRGCPACGSDAAASAQVRSRPPRVRVGPCVRRTVSRRPPSRRSSRTCSARSWAGSPRGSPWSPAVRTGSTTR